ncbi:MAG: DUF3568 family protein [Planctomycetota bacterium]
MKSHATAIVLAALVLALPGCAAAVVAAGAGAGAYAIFEGDIERQFDTDISTVWSAVREATAELGLEVTNDEFDGLEASMSAQRTDGQIVRIRAEGKGTATTRLKVRVGVTDKSKSRTILRRIEMGMPPGTPPSRDV